MTDGYEFSVDWLAFTIPADVLDEYGPLPLAERFGLRVSGVTEFRECGLLGWKQSVLLFPGALLAYGGQLGTAYLSLSGAGLRYAAELGVGFRDIIETAAELGCKCRRVDFAFDDHAVLDLDEVCNAWLRGQVRTRFDRFQDVRSWNRDAVSDGRTLYFGSRSSESFVRIYDKALQTGTQGRWIRVELELKGDRAHAVLVAWRQLDYATTFAAGILDSTISFIDAEASANSTRCPRLSWWDTFLCGVEKCRVVVSAKTRVLSDVQDWFYHSMAPTLALLHDVFGDAFVDDLLEFGRSNLAERHYALMLTGGFVDPSVLFEQEE